MYNYLQKTIEGSLDFERIPESKMYSKKYTITFGGFSPIQLACDNPNFTKIMNMTRACVDIFILENRDDYMIDFQLKYSMDETVDVIIFTLEKEKQKIDGTV